MPNRSLLLLALGLAPMFTLARTAAAQVVAPAREVEVVVERGYHPNRVVFVEGERVRLRFVRREYSPCTREVVFPTLNVRRELPVNQPVVVELPALAPGEYEFRCGMNMVRGTLVVARRGGGPAGP